MHPSQTQLPASALTAPLKTHLQKGNVIVGAPPGAGKSTVLPLSLLVQSDKKIIMLQPRRVVVRNLAAYLASLLDENVGETVGYRIRGEAKISAATRLEIVTEGVLSRLIQNDPELTGIDIVIFDEFHERSIHSDFGLALALEVQEGLRDDLRLVVMSATLDVDELITLVPKAEVLKTEGRQFPVEEVYLGETSAALVVKKTARAVIDSVHNDDGDILVFLPGVAVINQVRRELSAFLSRQNIQLHTLYGAMDKTAQQAALVPDENGRRKVILATNIAETSLTIEGVTVVVDSGLENVPMYHPATALTTLTMQMISQASATQRKGRAGRLGPGKVYRLWSKEHHHRLARFSLPQIVREDIAGVMLDALSWGTTLSAMALLTAPTSTQCQLAQAQLAAIGAVDEQGNITPYGRQLSALPVTPRMGHMLLEAKRRSSELAMPHLPQVACYCAAIIEESPSADSCLHLTDWIIRADKNTMRRIDRQAKRYARLINSPLDMSLQSIGGEPLSVCLALAFAQRVSIFREFGRYKMACGRGAVFPAGSHEKTPWLVVVSGQLSGGDVVCRIVEPIDEALLRRLYSNEFAIRETVIYNSQKKQMEARAVEGFGEIILQSEPASQLNKQAIGNAWVSHLQNLTIEQWPLSEQNWQWWHRYKLATSLGLPQPRAFDEPAEWRDAASPLALIDGEFLCKQLSAHKTWDALLNLPWAKWCHESLPWSQQHALDTLLPQGIVVPSGEKRKLKYRSDGEVILSVRLQEMFGCDTVLTVGDNNKVITVELLSPAGRPIQTTSDLSTFWRGSYFGVQKDMKGRYPKHRWPDNPMAAEPGKSIKPRKG
ncbi:ATP-dependent helicase HrpB [Aestuariibacter sp. A3R04]|uniref:ATP-dependent helicase HrpB n=1 Tax=Aestuariibacter sp. A3R04 TaxID=2841571 RepID=UPI001C09C8A3|nr:ATP-dependent helicase HrpB [Aestuariibacter sp. A3R04]MBU3020757.1 ATP-dependent helicase HrpB [Aestuariibacter sp. A3R04]